LVEILLKSGVIDLLHEELHAMCFARLDLNNPVEVLFRVSPSGLNVAVHHEIIRLIPKSLPVCEGGTSLASGRLGGVNATSGESPRGARTVATHP